MDDTRFGNGHTVVFLGGNGHCAARLAGAREALVREGLRLIDLRYPGFEGRARAKDLEAFLEIVSDEVNASHEGHLPAIVYATGIGGLIALCLRARGELLDVPLLLQAPVLWGLEHRWMPRLMRLRAAQAAVSRVFAADLFQRRFVRRHFMRPPSPEATAAFFDGYARCAALPDLFAWLTPDLLRHLERQLAAQPGSLRRVSVWWGGRDRVVTPREMKWTERALGTIWPLSVFPDWGHYPMLDEPAAWARALRGA
jgi:pimeloyl-ACP methyl ester carboxylesterase